MNMYSGIQNSKETDMDNFKRVLAWIAIIILGGMYIVTFIVSLVSSKDTMVWVWSSVYVTVVVSVLSYALIMIHNNMTKKREEERDRALRFSMAMRETVNKKKKELEEAEKKVKEEEEKLKEEEKAEELRETAEKAGLKETSEKIDEMIGQIREGSSEGSRKDLNNGESSENLSAVPGLYKLVKSGALTVEKAAEAADMTKEQFEYEVRRMGL